MVDVTQAGIISSGVYGGLRRNIRVDQFKRKNESRDICPETERLKPAFCSQKKRVSQNKNDRPSVRVTKTTLRVSGGGLEIDESLRDYQITLSLTHVYYARSSAHSSRERDMRERRA